MITPNSLAFPFLTHEELRDGPTTVTDLNNPGLTKLELFAMAAMQAVISSHDLCPITNGKMIAERSVSAARALLAALGQQPEATLPEHKEVK